MSRGRGEFTSANTSDFISFYINGELHEVRPNDGKFGPGAKLVDYIREEAKLTGTKFMCREGGCGACLVTVKLRNVSTGRLVIKSANSCLIPLFSCDGWRISTVESLGNKKTGYNKIQQQLVNFGGTQCGYCTPGMVMNMNSLLEEKAVVKTKDIEDLLDGNICRCTGYRPILDAFKSLTEDAPEEVLQSSLPAVHCEPAIGGQVPSWDELLEELPEEPQLTNIWMRFVSGEDWVVPNTIAGIFEAVQHFSSSGKNYRIVAGNTGTGVYKNEGPYKGFIDIINVAELGTETVDSTGITLGANVTLTHAIQFLKRVSRSQMGGYGYALPMNQHMKRIANVSVRNVGTLGGNLMLKHNHPEFPSDVFLLLTTLNATLSIASSPTGTEAIPMEKWLISSMANKLIVNIHIPRWTDNSYVFRSFKVSRRYQNAHPDVNAGFLLRISQDKNKSVIEKPNIVYGGINSSFIHATQTEASLVGKSLKDVSTLQKAMETLEEEIQPSNQLPDASPQYRKALTESLLYKTILQIVGTDASSKNQSGSKQIKKGKTKGKQVFDMDKTVWPLNKPVAKIEAAAQCSGEAIFISDILPQHRELFGAFVLSTIAKGDIESIDASEALKLSGVHAFIQAKDVPGSNNFMVYQDPEEIFCSGKIMYAGQSIGLILGETRAIAFEATKLVQVNYKNVEKPTLEPILPSEDDFDANWLTCVKMFDLVKGPKLNVQDQENSPAETIVEGEFKFGGQYHFHMETQVCLCVPKEDHLKIYSATQWIDHTQSAVAAALAIPSNEIQIEVKRIGGAYGSKICRASHIATACAVASKVTNRPVRVLLDLQTNMELIGKRSPYTIKYKVVVNDVGRITSLKASVFAEVGSVINDADIDDAVKFLQNCYDATGWEVTKSQVLTDKAPNTFCRAPGTSQGIAMIEHLMEHIVFQLKKDPLEIRSINFIHDGSPLLVPYSSDETTFVGENKLVKMIARMKKSTDYDSRTEFVSTFNKNNRWRKRGIAVVPIRYHLDFQGYRYPVYVAIYKNDGTVVVTHGGIEMGQGINTKVAQTVAYKFSIPVEKIRITASNNIIGANADLSGASVTSELCCYAASVACQILIDRMKPVKNQMKDPTWEQLTAACGKLAIDLTASHMYSSEDPVKTYDIWGLTVTEVEIDCLTGEYKILRVDLTEDAGRSLNPEVDIGQIEGAFVMAIGWWTTENLIHDSDSGKLLTNGTWEYKPPTAADIPADFRVTLLRKSPNPFGVLRSKATGEPPLCMGISVLFALRNAIFAARQDAGVSDYVAIDGPLTQEKIFINCLTNAQKFDV